MTISEAMKTAREESGVTQTRIADILGVKQSAVSMNMARDMKFSTAIVYANLMGYEIVMQKKRQHGRRPDGQMVIDEVKKK